MASYQKVLVIDDEEDVRTVLKVHLERAGFDVICAADGNDGLRRFYSQRPVLVILDVLMPGMDGWQVLERFREVSNVPVLMLTSVTREPEKIRGLASGADDYITKPFSAEELMARVQAVLRRAAMEPEVDANVGYKDSQITIDFQRHEVVVRGERVNLSATEFRLLRILTQHAGQLLAMDQLLSHVWGQEYAKSVDVVRAYIRYLRRKIEIVPSDPKLIETIRGFGYRYREPPSSRTEVGRSDLHP